MYTQRIHLQFLYAQLAQRAKNINVYWVQAGALEFQVAAILTHGAQGFNSNCHLQHTQKMQIRAGGARKTRRPMFNPDVLRAPCQSGANNSQHRR